jgi:hypothetical protein
MLGMNGGLALFMSLTLVSETFEGRRMFVYYVGVFIGGGYHHCSMFDWRCERLLKWSNLYSNTVISLQIVIHNVSVDFRPW